MANDISLWGTEIEGKFVPFEEADKISSWVYKQGGPIGRYGVKAASNRKDQRLVQSDRETMNEYLQPFVEGYLERHPDEPMYNVFAQDKLDYLMTGRDAKTQYAAGMQSLSDLINNGLIDYVDIFLQNKQMQKETLQMLKDQEKLRKQSQKNQPNTLFQGDAEAKNADWLKFYQDRVSGEVEPPVR